MRRKAAVLPLLLLLALGASPARAVTPSDIPSPRPDGWSVDLTGRVPAATLREIDRLGNEVKGKTGAEIAVVVIASTAGADPRDFATRLFNTWGVGRSGHDDG